LLHHHTTTLSYVVLDSTARTRMRARTHTHARTYVCTPTRYTHTHAHTHTHTCAQTHTHTPSSTMQQQLAHLSLREQHLAQQLHQPAPSAPNGRTNTHTHTPTPNGHTTHTNTRTPTSNGPAQPSAEQEVQVTADMGFAANSMRAAFNGLQVRISPPLLSSLFSLPRSLSLAFFC